MTTTAVDAVLAEMNDIAERTQAVQITLEERLHTFAKQVRETFANEGARRLAGVRALPTEDQELTLDIESGRTSHIGFTSVDTDDYYSLPIAWLRDPQEWMNSTAASVRRQQQARQTAQIEAAEAELARAQAKLDRARGVSS